MAEKNGLSTDVLLGIISTSVGAGVYHGYCDAQGIPFQKEGVEFALTYGPAIALGSLNAVALGLPGLLSGGALGTLYGINDKSLETTVAKGACGAVLGATTGASLGAAIGGANGGLLTLVGYGLGYLAGFATK